MTELEQSLEELYASDFGTRKRALKRLIALGDGAVAPLIALACSYKVVARKRAIEALGEIGDRRALWPLAGLDSELPIARLKALIAIVERLAAAPTRPDAVWFVEILGKFRDDPNGEPIVLAAAQGALKLAQNDPCPELLPVLDLLGSFGPYALPPECIEIRRELASLLARQQRPPRANLPRPADAPVQDAHDLPRPSSAD
nr:hypothetical protein [Armatimonas sp.]